MAIDPNNFPEKGIHLVHSPDVPVPDIVARIIDKSLGEWFYTEIVGRGLAKPDGMAWEISAKTERGWAFIAESQGVPVSAVIRDKHGVIHDDGWKVMAKAAYDRHLSIQFVDPWGRILAQQRRLE